MAVSVLSLSLSVVTPSAVVCFEYTTTRVSSDHNSHTFCSFCFCVYETVPFLLFVVGWSFLFVVAHSLAVFAYAKKFNQDVSKWNTGAVTNMDNSKCTLSPSLWPRLPLLWILNTRQLEFHRITLLTRFVIFVFLFLNRYSFLLFVVGWSSLFLVAPYTLL